MCFALEFLSIPRVLMLKLYAHLKPPERRTVIDNVRVHGCYRPGVPLLVDSTDNEAPSVLTDVRVLRAALASALPDSPIAILVKPASGPSDEALTEGGPFFTSRADALRWLAGWSVMDVQSDSTSQLSKRRSRGASSSSSKRMLKKR
jgi:hypothetical protein